MNICSLIATIGATIGWSGAGRSGVRISAEARGLSVLQMSSPTLEPTQAPIQEISVLFSGGTTGAGEHEVNHSSPSSVEVKSEWRPASVPYIRFHGVERKNVTFVFKGRQVLMGHKLPYH